MEQSSQLVKKNNLPFVEDSLSNLENALEYSNTLLQTKLCPRHFYETKPDKYGRQVPDYSKGKPGAVLMVIQHGSEVGMSVMQSLQQIIPINGLISIKGDGAKSLIFRSGKLKAGSWKEIREGNIQAKDLKVTITAERADNGEQLTRSFSVEDAMRAGLWITESKLQGKDAWKFKLSPWYRYPERMVKYRALGFLARDLFPDVLQGMVTEEEAIDYPGDEVVSVKTETGKELQIMDGGHLQERSDEVTRDAIKRIDKSELKSEESAEKESDDKLKQKVFTEKELINLGPKIYDLVTKTEYRGKPLRYYIDHIPGRISNKKCREAILKNQNSDFYDWLEQNEINKLADPESKELSDTDVVHKSDISDKKEEKQEDTSKEETQEEEKGKDEDDFEKHFDGAGTPEVKEESQTTKEVNKSDTSEEKTEPKDEKASKNKQEIDIPPVNQEGIRVFEGIKKVYDILNDMGVDNEMYTQITKGHEFGEQFRDKEDFCRRATVEQINSLLNSL